ncbi:hypothetical protein QBC36DRAFT_382944 [Triangularia setosa]|uniref:Uncharacterized protein n=1 Tax=Triangularia setosa TaxID=2587417 RepID=A0AAN7A2D1_9PEZI|nr:hypothetical protein QBC36DRAFT_382944 [Podospora setosa]
MGRRGADLNIRGFPNFRTFGTLTDLSNMEGQDLPNAKVSAFFKYASDPGTCHPVTTRTVELNANFLGETKKYKFGPDYRMPADEFTLSLQLQAPVAPWQIPTSRVPSTGDRVANLESEHHWGSGGTYLFSDPAIGSSVEKINPTVLNIEPSMLVPHKDVRNLFAAALLYDLRYPKYFDFPLKGIFSVLLGGGATTGAINTIGKTGPWTQDKVAEYMTAPTGP